MNYALSCRVIDAMRGHDPFHYRQQSEEWEFCSVLPSTCDRAKYFIGKDTGHLWSLLGYEIRNAAPAASILRAHA